jgi:prostaglandin-endoperoxide synthase 2
MPDVIEWPTGPIPIGDFARNNKALLDVGLDAAFSAAAKQPAGELGAFNTADALLDIEDRAVKQARANRLDTYNNYRKAFHMEPAQSFSQISSNPEVQTLLQQLYGAPDNVEFYPGLFAADHVPDCPLPELLLYMVAVDAFSQALTNPLLSEHVFNANTFTQWGLDLINSTSKLGDILARNVPKRGTTPIEMTQSTWHYVDGP